MTIRKETRNKNIASSISSLIFKKKIRFESLFIFCLSKQYKSHGTTTS